MPSGVMVKVCRGGGWVLGGWGMAVSDVPGASTDIMWGGGGGERREERGGKGGRSFHKDREQQVYYGKLGSLSLMVYVGIFLNHVYKSSYYKLQICYEGAVGTVFVKPVLTQKMFPNIWLVFAYTVTNYHPLHKT